ASWKLTRRIKCVLSTVYNSSFLCCLDGTCLNGGTSVSSLHSHGHMFCLCADGFGGDHCEIDMRANCYSGIGLYYRGTMSKSESGRTCQEWDLDTRERLMSSDVNSGRHNYCRNLDYKRRPWCYVLKKQRLVQEYSAHCFPDG
uniref:Uncharacterized protein n=1 Tax=Myripristis murdjan TaxID=586833 RepID=A0A667Z3A5_9TELE